MDLIELRNITAQGRHGANPGERDREQQFEADLKLELDLGSGECSDDLEQTLDYAKLHAEVVQVISAHSYYLLERLAGAILNEIFRDTRVARAEVRVGKPQLLDGATPSVTLRRQNPRFNR
ncbi:MAG: dihydroneopterin aldolase [Candidatus Baltobacteraceae bacterium]